MKEFSVAEFCEAIMSVDDNARFVISYHAANDCLGFYTNVKKESIEAEVTNKNKFTIISNDNQSFFTEIKADKIEYNEYEDEYAIWCGEKDPTIYISVN